MWNPKWALTPQTKAGVICTIPNAVKSSCGKLQFFLQVAAPNLLLLHSTLKKPCTLFFQNVHAV